MYSKILIHLKWLDPATAQDIADLLYEIGKESFRKQEHEIAVKWLERAYDVLSTQSLERLSFNAGDLRMNILHDLGMDSLRPFWCFSDYERQSEPF